MRSPDGAGCPREAEAVETLTWDDELRAHVVSCPHCLEVVELAAILRAERDAALDEASVPDSGQVWWKLRLRARRDAAHAAAAPVRAAQAIGAGLALIVSLAGGWFAVQKLAALVPQGGWTGSPFVLGVLGLGALAVLVLAPVAVWLALGDR